MQIVIQEIKNLFSTFSEEMIDRVEQLPQSGSDRIYFRIFTASQNYIATYNLNRQETTTFVAFSRQFRKSGSPVPQIFAVNDESTLYIQEDFGNISLLTWVTAKSYGRLHRNWRSRRTG